MLLFNFLVQGELLSCELQNLASKLETSVYRMLCKIFRNVHWTISRGSPMWQQ